MPGWRSLPAPFQPPMKCAGGGGRLRAPRGGGGRRGAADEQHPDIVAAVLLTPAQVVQGVLRGEAKLAPQAVGDEAVEAGAFVHLVEMRQRLALEEHAPAVGAAHGRAVRVVERALHEVAGGCEILQPLLVLDADGVAAELVGQTQGGDVHFALLQHLRLGELGCLVTAKGKAQAFFQIPRIDGGGVLIAHLAHGGVEGGLAEALLEAAGGVQQVVGHDGVEHAHAALVEDAEDGFARAEPAGEVAPETLVAGWQLEQIKISHMGLVVRDDPGGEPLAQAVFEKGVGEGLAPQG